MILDLILGRNIDTSQWVYELKGIGADYIAVLDYDLAEDYKVKENTTYISSNFAIKYVRNFDSVNYYKSLYVYPGMSGNMSSLKKI